MTERDASTGTVTTLEADPVAPFAQEPMDDPVAADGKSADRRAARDLKRAGRAERRADRKGGSANGTAPDAEDSLSPVSRSIPLTELPLVGPTTDIRPDPVVVILPPSEQPAADVLTALAADSSDEAVAIGEEPGAAPPTDSRQARRADRQSARAVRRDSKGGAESTAAVAAVATNTDADATAPAPADGSAPAAQPASLIRPQLAIVPGEDKEKQTAKAIARIESQHRQAEAAIAGVDLQGAAIAPLIRYVNAISHQLNESQKAIGKLQVERDALRTQVIGLNGVPVDVDALAEQAGSADHLAESAKLSRREGRKPETEKEPKTVEDMGRQRRLIALAGLAVLGTVALILRVTSHAVDLSNVSKNGLGSVAIIGSFMQVFLAGMIFYRLIRIGGRGAKWLFPENDPKAQKKLAQAKPTGRKRG